MTSGRARPVKNQEQVGRRRMYCKHCGAPLHEGVVICPECGARQRRRTQTIRCASCHHRVPLGLTVCPYCARTVRPAGPRWAVWLGVTAVLALAALWGLGKIPVERVAQQVAAVRQQATELVQVLGPVEAPTTRPLSTPQVVAQATSEPTPTPPAPTATELPTLVPMLTETEVEPTAQPEPSPTAEISSTPAPTETPTQAPTPTASPTPPATPTPTRSTGGNTTYRVKSGDTLSTIAAQFGITWEALAAANGLNSRSVLRIGQELIIPSADTPARPPATATAVPRPAQPPTPTPLPPTPAPSLPAPVQLNPGDQTPFSGGEAFIELVWQPVPGVPPGAQYEVQIRWLEEGAPQELNPPLRTTQDRTRVPLWLFGKADQPARRYTWTVRVVEITTDGQGGEKVIPLSPASPARIFYWG